MRVVNHEGEAKVLMTKVECDDMKGLMEDSKSVMLKQRRQLQAAPEAILSALNAYGAFEDAEDNPENYKMLLHVAHVAMVKLEIEDDG